MKADSNIRARIDELGVKANEGTLTSEEQEEYFAVIDALDLISIVQAKARAALKRNGTSN